MPVYVPEAADRHGQAQAGVRVVLEQPPERRPQVVVLLFQPLEPLRLPARRTSSGSACFGQRQEELGVPPRHLAGLPALAQALARVLADRLQHPVARRLLLLVDEHERLVDEPREQVQHLEGRRKEEEEAGPRIPPSRSFREQTASAASSVHPPAKTLSRRSSTRSCSVSSS